jgi:DNA segregation ATPase FtsK/SpoIIIE, S-DNA-T family
MARPRSRKARQPSGVPAAWNRIRGWQGWKISRPALGPMQRDLLGLALMILAVLTLLGLSSASTGAVLTWWATTLRRFLGWGAYVAALGLGLLGLCLLWDQLRQKLSLPPASWVGVELILLVALVVSQLPSLLALGVDDALPVAEQGQGGGAVGWALGTLLLEGLGTAVGAAVLGATLLLALYLLLAPAWPQMLAVARSPSRRLVALLNRWWARRQGSPVAPALPEVPWWEKEPEPGTTKKRAKTQSRARRAKSTAQSRDGGLPPIDLLDAASPAAYGDADIRRKVQVIEETLLSFGVPAKVVEINQGPAVTQFGLDPGYIERRVAGGEVRQERVRVARIANLVNDLALALAAAPIRVEAPVPGRSVVGLEVPNEKASLVSLRGVIESREFLEMDSPLALALGEDVAGHPAVVDLALMPHLLIAGATGSGKSVCINAIICCLLFNNSPAELKMLMVDPKMVELVGYNDIPHLIAPVVIETEQVVGALSWVSRQMDARYKLFHQAGVRNLEQYNVRAARRSAEEPLPTLIVIIDELADLMMVAPDEVERHITRLAQMGRATGIHLVIATQRPSVDVVTGLIKANFPARISFAVTSQVDSRVILDQVGAESLLGRGDMLFMAPQRAAPIRLQGCYVSDKEIDRLTDFWRQEQAGEQQPRLFPPWLAFEDEPESDELLEQALDLLRGRSTVSTSFMQRQLRIGFPRAARLMEQLEDQGYVGPDLGAGRGRQVLGGAGIDFDEIDERLPGQEPG